MKFTEAETYNVDENTEITDLFDAPKDANFDSVITDINGYHPEGSDHKDIVNEKSQKSYYILEGEGKIKVGKKIHIIEKGDFVYVPEETEHSLEGEFRALIVTSPPYNPEDEKLV